MLVTWETFQLEIFPLKVTDPSNIQLMLKGLGVSKHPAHVRDIGNVPAGNALVESALLLLLA
jgi:hypothetical protein